MQHDIIGARIHITGIVQGVGFRPYIYSLADRYQLKGWVRNTSAGVDIEVDGSREVLDSFIHAIQDEVPMLARLDSLDVKFTPSQGHSTFEIVVSKSIEGEYQPISPDVGICEDCLRELFDPADRRYRYPFINCTNCGPRFTIINDIPYDRPKTSMAKFQLCKDCEAEYHDPLNRRFHAQPVACPICGPHIWLEFPRHARRHLISGTDRVLHVTQELLAGGKIIAIKGLGGFHLACDATNLHAVALLRRRKLRVDKPFALMMPDIENVDVHCVISPEEIRILSSYQRPILLLKRKPEGTIVEPVAPKQLTLGVMLPYTPLHYLLFSQEGAQFTALVMTSGNLAEEPIAYQNDEAMERLATLADAFLMHNRGIVTRCDDSVGRVFKGVKNTNKESEKKETNSSYYPIRRSRGYSPQSLKIPCSVQPTLAVGGELKNTFCLARDDNAFMSHHIGDLENYETLMSFTDGVNHYEKLFRIHPQSMACDLHPGYLSTQYAQKRSDQEGIPLTTVQHHHAHVAACMGDNGMDGSSPVIGLAFDGTGYGTDGAIWGGEVLIADYKKYERSFHLKYFPLPGGDAGIKTPARIALALLWSLGIPWVDAPYPDKTIGRAAGDMLEKQLVSGLNVVQTSSMGRFFDAIASIIGVKQIINYEPQAAIELEALVDEDEKGTYPLNIHEDEINYQLLIDCVLADLKKEIPPSKISTRFHNGISDLVVKICDMIEQERKIKSVVLSGGVWQNLDLLKKTHKKLSENGFSVYTHHQVPTNDGGIALGQLLVNNSKNQN